MPQFTPAQFDRQSNRTIRVALIGQSAFGAAVYKEFVKSGFTVCGVFTIPDANGKADALAVAAEADHVPVFKFDKWRALKKDGGKVLPDVYEKYTSVKAEVNVLAYVTQFIPMEVIDFPPKGSIIYHPSLLPKHRGASAINCTTQENLVGQSFAAGTLMQGDKKTGITVFWADAGLDTGPILLQKEVNVEPDDTVNGLYKRFLFPKGVEALVESVQLIRDGKAPRVTQPSDGASYEELWTDKSKARINWNLKDGESLEKIHNFIRGSDRVPGAWTVINGQEVTLYDSSFLGRANTNSATNDFQIDGINNVTVSKHANGLLFQHNGESILIKTIQIGKTTKPATEFGK